MYVRPQNYRYGIRLPQNYAGNAFGREDNEGIEATEANEASEEKEAAESKKNEDADNAAEQASAQPADKKGPLLSNGGFKLRLGSLLGDKFGNEELLLLAVILLLADSEDSEDLLLFLILLLFIK